MNKRINVILPTTTVAVLDKLATKGNRSALIFFDRATQGSEQAESPGTAKAGGPHQCERDLQTLVIQNDVSNQYSPITIVAAIALSVLKSALPKGNHHRSRRGRT